MGIVTIFDVLGIAVICVTALAALTLVTVLVTRPKENKKEKN